MFVCPLETEGEPEQILHFCHSIDVHICCVQQKCCNNVVVQLSLQQIIVIIATIRRPYKIQQNCCTYYDISLKSSCSAVQQVVVYCN